MPYYLSVLLETLERKKTANPRFSIRAFARTLGVNPGALAQILKGRRFFSAKLAQRMFPTLGLDVDQRTEFLRSLALTKKQSGFQRIDRGLKGYLPEAEPSMQIQADCFRVIADWYHYALMELTFVADFQDDPKWIAAELGITGDEAAGAVERLLRVGLLERVNGKLQKKHSRIITANPQVTTEAHRIHQEQMLRQSIASLHAVPISQRNHTTMTLAIDQSRITEAKTKLERFMEEFTDFLDVGPRSKVYEISFQLFPLQGISQGSQSVEGSLP